MNKSTELCLHNCKKTNLQYCKGESTIFKFYHLFFGNCNRLLFYGRLHFIDEKAKVNAKYYVESLLPSLVTDCNRLLPGGFIFLQDGAPAHTAQLTQTEQVWPAA